MKQKEIIIYWIETSKLDLENFIWLYQYKRYYPCLFFGHLLIEKALKALVIAHAKKLPPYTHDLLKLIELSKVSIFSMKEKRLIKIIGKYNIEARYPEYKKELYNKATKEYTDIKYKQILSLYEKICNKVQQSN